jgi:two-component system, OmpR family, response regulator
MFPKLLALIDDDLEYGQYLAQHLRGQGVQTQVFDQATLFLASPAAYDFDFYVVDLSLPGIDGVELIKVIRVRTNAGVLVVSGRASPDVFASVVKAGADMYLAKPVNFEQVLLAIEAVHRRSGHSVPTDVPWRLDLRAGDLVAPDGARVSLSETDLVVMKCLAASHGAPVSREALREALGYSAEEAPESTLNATIFRLRRRIERATPLPVPLQAKSRVGYQFRAALSVA